MELITTHTNRYRTLEMLDVTLRSLFDRETTKTALHRL